MRWSLFLLLIAMTFPSFAQVKTGGGIFGPEHETIDSDSEHGTGEGAEQFHKLLDFTIHLKERDKLCRDDNKGYLTNSLKFMDVYLKLSMLSTTFTSDTKCSDVGIYLSCLMDKKANKYLRAAMKDKKMEAYLAKEYGITKEEAGKMLQFFKKIK